MMGSFLKGVWYSIIVFAFAFILMAKTDIDPVGIIGVMVAGLALAIYVGLEKG